MATTGRGFTEIDARNFACQKKKQRFPNSDGPHTVAILSDVDSDDDDPPLPEPAPHDPPHIAQWRSNLVALSQRDNLYFAAFQDKIHVTIPRGLKQTLRGKPDLILDLPRSAEGIRVGGYIDQARGHCVNHMTVGNLGTHEIVLVACDDGDVIAYYTHAISAEIKGPRLAAGQDTCARGTIKPLFHENVGVSAWGLAIHEKSRIIAVSSNNREVTVFVHGYTYEDEPADSITWDAPGTTMFPELSTSRKRSRTDRCRSFRRVLKLGPEGHNIPSIDFASDCDGDAKSVLATDILGNLWILGIWGDADEIKRIPSMYRSGRESGTMGWGALVLPLSAFKRTRTAEEALGIRDLRVALHVDYVGTKVDKLFDVTGSLRLVTDSSQWHPIIGRIIVGPAVLGSNGSGVDGAPVATTGLLPEAEEEEEEEVSLPKYGTLQMVRNEISTTEDNTMQLEGFERFHTAVEKIITSFEDNDFEGGEMAGQEQGQSRILAAYTTKYFRSMINTPLKVDDTTRTPKEMATVLVRYNNRLMNESELLDSLGEVQPSSPVFLLPDKSAILRTYQFDIELIPPAEGMMKTVCRRALKQRMPTSMVQLRPFERLCLLTSIPELSLVIVGSQIGRVALITLTRPDDDGFSHHGPVVMFRIDRILPGKKHEDDGLRPTLPLLGMAVSPLQVQQQVDNIAAGGGGGGREMIQPRRWRLILHYYDHSILSYELSRNEQTDDLQVL